MLNFGERKDLLVLLIIGILIVVAVMIFSLIMIWSPKDEDDEFYVGEIPIIQNISDEYKLTTYLDEISQYLLNKNYEELYSYISKDYIEYLGLDVDKLRQKCEQLRIAGDQLVVGSFETNAIEGYNKIYIINALTKNEGYSIRMVLREVSPKNFTISFDEFVLQKKSIEIKNAENIVFELSQTRYTSTNVFYDIKITNKNLDNVEFNSTNKVSMFVLNYGNESIDESTQRYSQPTVLRPSESMNVTLSYKIDGITWDKIDSITIRDVKLSNDRLVNLNFEI